MKTCLIPILLVMSLVSTWAAETPAPVTEANDQKRNAAMQAVSADGKEGKDLQAVIKDFPQNDYQSQQKLDRMVRTEVLRIIAKKYGSRFTVVLDGDNNDSVIYLDGEIVDLTQTLKQAIQLNDF